MRWALVCVLVGACYRPNAPEGAPCGANGACPTPLHCDPLTNTCISGDGPPAATCTFRDVSAGRTHTCALDATGAVWCWGLNDTGQSAPGDASRFALAATRIALPGPAAQVAAGRGFSCARLEMQNPWIAAPPASAVFDASPDLAAQAQFYLRREL